MYLQVYTCICRYTHVFVSIGMRLIGMLYDAAQCGVLWSSVLCLMLCGLVHMWDGGLCCYYCVILNRHCY